MILLETEQAVQAEDEPFSLHDFSDGQDNAGHKALPAVAVVPDGKGLPQGAQDYFLMGQQAGQADAVDGDAANLFTAAGGVTLLRWRYERLTPGGGHSLGRGQGSAGGGVHLAIVVKLNYLGVVHISGRYLGHVNHKDGTQSEVGSDNGTYVAGQGQAVNLGQVCGGEAAGAYYRPDAVLYGCSHRRHGGPGDAEIHQYIRLAAFQEGCGVGRDRNGAGVFG
jgi:hypothetical protein